MDEQAKLGQVYLDFTPNGPKDEIGRQNAVNRLTQDFERRLEGAVERQWNLPPIMVILQGEYLELLREARDLYIDGRFYSCVAMCGIVSERLIKDMLRASVLIVKDGKVERPESEAFNQLERVDISSLARFIQKTGLLSEEAYKAAKNLGELRNDYAHARGRQSQNDALKAIKYLHQVVEGTVSIFKDHEFKDGAWVRKTVDGA
jgi:hypothetical protein